MVIMLVVNMGVDVVGLVGAEVLGATLDELKTEIEVLLTGVALEVLEAELSDELPDELPEVELPEVELNRDVAESDAETSVGHRANGYVVPETTVPAAARSLR